MLQDARELSGFVLVRPCPNCGSQRSSAAISHPLPAEDSKFEDSKASWIGHFKKRTFFSYCRCGDCGLIYCSKYLKPEYIAALYELMVDNTFGIPLDALVKTNHGYMSILPSHLDLEAGYLEAGPDIGIIAGLIA